MGIVEYAARGLLGELDKTTQEFYGFIMPAIEMYEDGNDRLYEAKVLGLF